MATRGHLGANGLKFLLISCSQFIIKLPCWHKWTVTKGSKFVCIIAFFYHVGGISSAPSFYCFDLLFNFDFLVKKFVTVLASLMRSPTQKGISAIFCLFTILLCQ